MALYSVVFLGSTPIGAPLVGWLAEVAGPRVGHGARRVRGAGRGRAGERRLRARRRAPGRQDGRRGVESRRVLVDLHAHYPMHLIPPEQADTQAAVTARRPGARWKAIIIDLLLAAAELPGPQGRAQRHRRAHAGRRRRRRALGALLAAGRDGPAALLRRAAAAGLHQLRLRADRPRRGSRRASEALGATVAHDPAALDAAIAAGQTAIVHCIEGGFALGATPAEIDANVAELARRGVAYVTLAHLFWRGVATNAPALPFMPDWLYKLVFTQPKSGADRARHGGRARPGARAHARRHHAHDRARDRRHLRHRRRRRRR